MEEAVRDVVSQLGRRGEADLALGFASTGYASDLPRLLPLLRRELRSRHWLGAAGGGGGAQGGRHLGARPPWRE